MDRHFCLALVFCWDYLYILIAEHKIGFIQTNPSTNPSWLITIITLYSRLSETQVW
jgi:hypothetical protein